MLPRRGRGEPVEQRGPRAAAGVRFDEGAGCSWTSADVNCALLPGGGQVDSSYANAQATAMLEVSWAIGGVVAQHWRSTTCGPCAVVVRGVRCEIVMGNILAEFSISADPTRPSPAQKALFFRSGSRFVRWLQQICDLDADADGRLILGRDCLRLLCCSPPAAQGEVWRMLYLGDGGGGAWGWGDWVPDAEGERFRELQVAARHVKYMLQRMQVDMPGRSGSSLSARWSGSAADRGGGGCGCGGGAAPGAAVLAGGAGCASGDGEHGSLSGRRRRWRRTRYLR